MTRERAIKILECMAVDLTVALADTKEPLADVLRQRLDAIDVAQAALTPPTQEQMERVFGGSWEGSGDGYADGELVYDIWTCSDCGYVIDEEDDPDMLPDFCPKCGAANTDKAREIIKARWEALNDGKGD